MCVHCSKLLQQKSEGGNDNLGLLADINLLAFKAEDGWVKDCRQCERRGIGLFFRKRNFEVGGVAQE
jgi:hypothetical protein